MRPLSNRARDAEGDGRKRLPSVSPKDRARSKPGASRKGSVRPEKESAGKIPDIIDNNFRPLWDRYQSLIWEQVPLVYLVRPYAFLAVRNKWENVTFDALDSFDIRYVFEKKE